MPSPLEKAFESLELSAGEGVGLTLKRIRIGKAIECFRKAIKNEKEARSNEAPPPSLLAAVDGLLTSQLALLKMYSDQDYIPEIDSTDIIDRVAEVMSLAAWEANFAPEQVDETGCKIMLAVRPLLQCRVRARGSEKEGQAQKRFLRQTAAKLSLGPAKLFDASIALRLDCARSSFELVYYEAIGHYQAGRWSRASALLAGEESALQVAIELEAWFESRLGPAGIANHEEEGYEKGALERTQRDFRIYGDMCRTKQLLSHGDAHFKAAGEGNPEDLLGRAQLAQDDYRAALLLIAGKDLELEGTALVRIARFHAQVTKLVVVAHKLYLRALELATTLQPTIPSSSWYQEAQTAVKARREALERQEAKQWANERLPYLQQLEDEMKKLEDHKSATNLDFCKFVWTTWPPKTEGAKNWNEVLSASTPGKALGQKAMVKIIARYHSDKNDKPEWGPKWRVLSEEICKALTERYNMMKGVD